MSGFEEAWAAVNKPHDGEDVTPRLQTLLSDTYREILAYPKDYVALKAVLLNLLAFLAGEGRTNANCWAVDLFFALSQGWEADWTDQRLPEEFHEVLCKMGEALHDTVLAKHIAEDFGCLPEQLLSDVNRIRVGSTGQ